MCRAVSGYFVVLCVGLFLVTLQCSVWGCFRLLYSVMFRAVSGYFVV